MREIQNLALVSALAALTSISIALPHGDEMEGGMTMGSGAMESATIDTMTEFEYNPSYFHYNEHAGLINAHIMLSILSWTIVLPLAVMFSIARSRYTVLGQTAFLVTNGLGLLTGIIYNMSTPELYENNKHHTIGWTITWLAFGWAAMGVVLSVAGAWTSKKATRPVLHHADSDQTLGDYHSSGLAHKMEGYRWSDDSGQGTERNTNSLCTNSRTASMNSGTEQFSQQEGYQAEDYDIEEEAKEGEKRGFLGNTRMEKAIASFIPRLSSGKGVVALKIAYTILERLMVVLGFFGITTGIVVYGGIFHGNDFFSGLAHFVKGGIFVWYGLLTFGRWMGCFADFGWAWNIKPGADIVGKGIAWIPSAEFTESFVIWLYGATNVFMEHMGDRSVNNTWSPMDLEHVSIAILFFGGGMLGMLIESSFIRELLSNTLNSSSSSHPERWATPKHFVHSLNPVPALTIMLMGIMMSSHTQNSMVSSMMHKYWGQLFVAFAMSRGLTYITLALRPPTSYLPTRPPTEIIASFCLISGGLLFMMSNHDTVSALEHYNLHAMFLWSLVMSFVAMIMAWQLLLIAIKNWAVRHEASRISAPAKGTSPA